MLRLKDIKKSYRIGPSVLEVLKGVTLDVSAGEFLAISGASGCGKSTLMNILGLLDKPDEGSYAIEDREVSYDDDDSLSVIRNRKIGFVFQHYSLLPKLTALDNVGVPLLYRGENRKEARQRSIDLLRKVGLQDIADHKPSELSGGQQQRVSIARALVGDPMLLLADEPTGALDKAAEEEVMDLFVRLNVEYGITIVIITHSADIAKQSKRLVSLKDGVVIEK